MIHVTHRRRFERLVAILSAVGVLMSMMVVFAPAALAHHPEISANQECDEGGVAIAYDSVSWRTDGGSGSAHNDIRIEIQVNGTGPWTEVGNGAYNAGNSYRFSGSFDASSYVGQSVVIRARAVGAWTNGQGGGETRETSAFVIDLECTETVTVSANPQACAVDRQGQPRGTVSFEIDPSSGASVQVYTNSNFTGPVGGPLGDGVPVSLTPGTYYWQATAAVGYQLEGPASGSFTIAPCQASAVVVSGNCVVSQGVAQGAVQVTIDPTSGATVTVYDSEDDVVASFTGGGGSKSLPPGDYTWTATAGNGYQLPPGQQSGELSITPCDATVTVSGRCVLDGVTGTGVLEVAISPAGGVTVRIFDGATLVDTLSSSGAVSVPEGKTYTWSASAASGFSLEGPSQGSVAIEDCSRSIVVDASTACIDNTPYLSWDITPVNFTADEVTVTWQDLDPSNPLYSTVHGLQGQMPWPGAVLEDGVVVDWPGWLFVDPDTLSEVPLGTEGGIWIPGDDGYLDLRPETSVEFSVNPSTVVVVDYPPGDPDCEGPPPEIFMEIGSMCLNDTPYLTYESVLSGNVSGDLTASIHWFDGDGEEQVPADGGQSYTGLPLRGSVLWPGARVDSNNEPVDWPGWTFAPGSGSALPSVDTTGSVTAANGATGKWVQGDDGFLWAREAGAYVTVEVNPTSDPVQVSYPPGTPTCTAGPPDVVKGIEVLPFTGLDSEILLGASILMLGAGITLIHLARRREEG